MNYIQNIDWYKNKYLEKDFINKESLHYFFHFEKETLANQNINQIIELKESHYDNITKWLDVSNNKKIDYYIYPNIKEKILLMGDDSPGNTIWEELSIDEKGNKPKKFEIHVVYNEKCKFIGEHEDTHLLSLPWGLSIYLFCEGLAQFMEDSFMGQELHEIARKLKEKNKLYSIEFLCSNENWEDVEPIIIYPQVGSFAKFLINQYSKESFKDVYQNTSRNYDLSENLEEIKKVYNKSISELELEWLSYIN
ncbi:MAG: hypothetical protein PHR47_00140 [Candidatus Pacebacteria bacterium]|nr:hypothetical protein [Candidatus Paceibacterota bacterium]